VVDSLRLEFRDDVGVHGGYNSHYVHIAGCIPTFHYSTVTSPDIIPNAHMTRPGDISMDVWSFYRQDTISRRFLEIRENGLRFRSTILLDPRYDKSRRGIYRF
jgi:hypothetical protein